jgi:hypothetical protein
MNDKSVEWKINTITESLRDFLVEKNKRYGNAALEPQNVFSKDNAENSILIRIDDKINRIKNSNELRKEDIHDLMGYLVLLCIDKGWLTMKYEIDRMNSEDQEILPNFSGTSYKDAT